jgi:hypothetical protein
VTAAELRAAVKAHGKWLRGETGGSRADLRGAVLRGADLRGAVLTRAVLRGADLTGAVLRGADLTGADLTGADLRGADLTRADLTGADLTGAVLRGADLTGAVLTGAVLTRADLTGAVLRGADLTGAVLRGAVLTGAVLRGAVLRGADLRGADLTGAVLTPIRDDVWNVLDAAPAEVPALVLAVREGRVNGSAYQGECACLLGTIANVRGCKFDDLGPGLRPDSERPAEKWFLAIRTGDRPETSQVSAIVADWIVEWQAAHPPAALAPAEVSP